MKIRLLWLAVGVARCTDLVEEHRHSDAVLRVRLQRGYLTGRERAHVSAVSGRESSEELALTSYRIREVGYRHIRGDYDLARASRPDRHRQDTVERDEEYREHSERDK